MDNFGATMMVKLTRMISIRPFIINVRLLFMHVIVFVLVEDDSFLVGHQVLKLMHQITIRSEMQVNKRLNNFIAVVVFSKLHRQQGIDGYES